MDSVGWHRVENAGAGAIGVGGKQYETGREPRRKLASGWVEQEVSRYLDYYSPDYTSDNYNNHQAWAKSRDRSLTRPSYIRIQLDDVQVVPLTPQTIQVTFWQAYESNTFKDRVRKKLVWQNQNDQWKIVQENVLYD